MADTNSTNRKKTLSPPESTRRKQTKGIPAKKTIPKSTVKKKVKSKALPQKKSKSHDSSTSPTVKKKTTVKKKSTTKTVPVSPAQTSAKKRPPVSKKKSASPLPQEKSPSSSRPKGKRLRKTPTGTISQIYYRQLRERSKRTKLIQTIILLSVGCAAAIVILWYAQHRVQKSNLLKLSTHGFIALEEDQLEEAETIFSRVVSMYKSYHTKHPDWWFKQDAFVFTTLLRIAQCWRSLGDYESAFDTYRSVSLHNVEGHESWVGLQLESEFLELIDHERWTDSERQAMYTQLLQTDPLSWGTGGVILVKATERASLKIVPMKERIDKADVIIYGIPQRMDFRESRSMRVEGLLFYKIEHSPGPIEITIPSTLNENERQRLFWYANEKRECLIFGKADGMRSVLDGIEGMILSEPYNVETFNDLIE